MSAIEKLAGEDSAAGLAIPDDVLDAVDEAVDELRLRACFGKPGPLRHCIGLPETAALARLRAVLEGHAGARSSEHLRVYAQGFLGDGERLGGLRAALRAVPENARARCDLARALAVREETAEARGIPRDDDAPECQGHPSRGPTEGCGWADREDYTAWTEREQIELILTR